MSEEEKLQELENYALDRFSTQIQHKKEAETHEEKVRCNDVAMAWRGMVNKIRKMQGRQDELIGDTGD